MLILGTDSNAVSTAKAKTTDLDSESQQTRDVNPGFSGKPVLGF